MAQSNRPITVKRGGRAVNRIAQRARNINILLIAIIFVITAVSVWVVLYSVNGSLSENTARSSSTEIAERFAFYISSDLVLAQKSAKSIAVTEWFGDEENAEKKLAAYNEMMDYIGMLDNAVLSFGVEEPARNQYSIFEGMLFEDFQPHENASLDTQNSKDKWYFDCLKADGRYEYLLNIGNAEGSDLWQLWINHKVSADGKTIGVLRVGLEIDDMIHNLFSRYDDQNLTGYLINNQGYIILDSTMSKDYGRRTLSREIGDYMLTDAVNEYLKGINGVFGQDASAVTVKLSKGNAFYGCISPIKDTDLSVVVLVDQGLFSNSGEIRTILALPLILLFVLILFLFVHRIYLNHSIFIPLHRLTLSVSDMKTNSNDIYGADRNDEIGDLAYTIQESSLEERRLVQNARASAAKLNAVVSNYAGVIFSVDRRNVITLFNGLYLKKIGVTPDFVEGKSLDKARLINRHLDIIDKIGLTYTSGEQSWISEIDGMMFRAHTTPIYDEAGRIAGVVGSMDDLTETLRLQKDLESALEKAAQAVSHLEAAQRTVSAMFDANPYANILFDEKLNIIDCNPAAIDFIGFHSKEEMMAGFSERLVQILPKTLSGDRPVRSVEEWIADTIKDGAVRFETELTINGITKNVSVEMKRIPYGDIFAIVVYIYDMTEIHQREMELVKRDQQLLEAVEEAHAANKAKSVFLSTMSHEIRTPMNAILGITEIMLQKNSLTSEMRDSLERVYSSGDMLLGIINDILDLSKIEAGKLELFNEKYEIASLISDTAQLNMMRIGSKRIEFIVDVHEDVPMYLTGDELRMKQVLNNILSNAFKYSSEGEVVLHVHAEPGTVSGIVVLVFRISDTGQGMTREQVGELFNEYARFNAAANRTTEGTGLGMKITWNLVHLLGGEILVESEFGVGTVFTVRLPQERIGDATLGKELVENLKKFRTSTRSRMKRVQITRELMPYGSVLVVDDVETNIYVAKGLLTPYELQIDSADSGFAAIDKIKQGKQYDIIFMDHMMPKMDGIEATRIIRSMGYARPIVALTANAVSGQEDTFLNNGFDGFISKPVDVRQMNAVLNKHIRDKQPQITQSAEESNPEREKTSAAGGKNAAQLDPKFEAIFVRDAMKSVEAIEGIHERDAYGNPDDMRTYIIHVHGMKSALAYIGETGLSAEAMELEKAARNEDIAFITATTAAFIAALKALIVKFSPDENNTADEKDEDPNLLKEKLREILAECEQNDVILADTIMPQLQDMKWSASVKSMLNTLSENLLYSDFDAAAEGIVRFLESYNN